MKINAQHAPKPVGLYPHARRVGNLLFLSGVGPRVAGSDATDSMVPGLVLDKNGNFLEFDFEAQCRSVFDNVRLILEASGSSWDELVDVRTTVEINSLPTPICIELKCIATIKD
jgi:2-aminomuconate deaminase